VSTSAMTTPGTATPAQPEPRALSRSGAGFISDTLLIFRRQLRLSLRNPAWVIIGLVQPILYLAFFGPLLKAIASNGMLAPRKRTTPGRSSSLAC
jgi:ABC-2 type transport system permease protein